MQSLLRGVCGVAGRAATPARRFIFRSGRGVQTVLSSPTRHHAASAAGRDQLAEYRRLQLDQIPQRLLRVAGVSFDNRQDQVRRLTAGQGVAFVEEPDNEYDPNAVAVETLSGAQLGYVPRGLTRLFSQHQTFGRVQSVGQEASSGLFGLAVAVRPALPSLTVEAFPVSLGATESSLHKQLSSAECQRIREYAMTASSATCQITGAPGDTFAEAWRWDVDSRTILLEGVYCVHRGIRQVKDMSHLPAQEFGVALKTLQEINGWTSAECKQYLNSVARRSMELSSDGDWIVDVSWLCHMGICDP